MESLLLPLTYKGVHYDFPLRIVPQGFVYHFVVLVGALDVVFERDDSGDFRALIYNQDVITTKLPEPDLLAAISEVLGQL